MTTIYFMRHSKAIKPNNINNNDSLQLQNEKWILSKEGEEIAKEKSELEELNYFDIVFSSNYARAIGTAKYFANTINIDEKITFLHIPTKFLEYVEYTNPIKNPDIYMIA